MPTLDDYLVEAEHFFETIFSALEGAFGVGSPLTISLTDLSAKLKADKSHSPRAIASIVGISWLKPMNPVVAMRYRLLLRLPTARYESYTC